MYQHVDSEDIANEKIRTNDLALERNKVSIEDETNNKESEHDHINGYSIWTHKYQKQNSLQKILLLLS